MHRIAALSVALIFLVAGARPHAAGDTPTSAPAQEHGQWIRDVLAQISAIKHGTTRREFEKTFVMDGGLNGVKDQRYCYREALCIKVNATFETPSGSKDQFADPDARLTELSKPYLETPYAD
jgi:hypothetical protein